MCTYKNWLTVELYVIARSDNKADNLVPVAFDIKTWVLNRVMWLSISKYLEL